MEFVWNYKKIIICCVVELFMALLRTLDPLVMDEDAVLISPFSFSYVFFSLPVFLRECFLIFFIFDIKVDSSIFLNFVTSFFLKHNYCRGM